MEQRMVTVLLLFDFSKAFDSIDLKLLCDELDKIFNFGSCATALIRNYFSGRWQYVNLSNDSSGQLPIVSGIRQGRSNFFLFFKQFSGLDWSLTEFHKFADDTQL